MYVYIYVKNLVPIPNQTSCEKQDLFLKKNGMKEVSVSPSLGLGSLYTFVLPLFLRCGRDILGLIVLQKSSNDLPPAHVVALRRK